MEKGILNKDNAGKILNRDFVAGVPHVLNFGQVLKVRADENYMAKIVGERKDYNEFLAAGTLRGEDPEKAAIILKEVEAQDLALNVRTKGGRE